MSSYPQGPYPQPGPYSPPPTRDNWMGITSLIAGIISLFCTLPGVLAIVFGALGMSAVTRGTANNKGLCIAGIVTGVLGILISIAWRILATYY